MSIIDQTKEESVAICSNVVHFNSNLFFVMNLLDSDVLVKSIFGFNDHELIYVIMFDFVIYEICLLVVLMALHSSSDLGRA